MKRSFLATAARSGLSTVFLAYSAIACCTDDSFSNWAAAHAIPLATLEADAEPSDLMPLKSAIGNARVIGLGEPSHGAHEPLAFRNRLIRFLVEQMGVTAVALESGFTESNNARSFVEEGDGDAASAAQSGLPGLDRYLETRQLLQWMRDYNATAASRGHRKIRLYGIDITAGGRLSGPRRTIDSALQFLSLADPATAQQIRSTLSDSLPATDTQELGSLPAAAQKKFEASIRAIAKAMHKSRKELLARASEDDYHWAVRNLDVARQLAKCLPITPPLGAAMSLWVHATRCRDAAMAKNVQWALRNEGWQGRLLVFAHLGHIVSGER